MSSEEFTRVKELVGQQAMEVSLQLVQKRGTPGNNGKGLGNGTLLGTGKA